MQCHVLVPQQQQEQVVLLGGQRHHGAALPDSVGPGVHFHVLHPQLPLHAVEPEDVLHPEYQLLQLKGLHQIVVRPHVEPAGLVGDLPLCGDEDGRNAVLPQVGEQLVPVDLGQHDVQQRQGVPVLLDQIRPRLPVKSQLHLIPSLGQGRSP